MKCIKHVSSPLRKFRTLEIENASRVPTLGFCPKNLFDLIAVNITAYFFTVIFIQQFNNRMITTSFIVYSDYLIIAQLFFASTKLNIFFFIFKSVIVCVSQLQYAHKGQDRGKQKQSKHLVFNKRTAVSIKYGLQPSSRKKYDEWISYHQYTNKPVHSGNNTIPGSLVNICPTGNSDCKSFLATELMLGGMIMRSVHNG